MTSSVFDQLMSISREQFAAAHYEAAYHALATALHVAHDARDATGVLAVQEEALDQMSWLDAHLANHPLSTLAAHRRGEHTLWQSLVRQAETMLMLLVQRSHEQG